MTDDAHGTLLGLACGDALGRPVEFESPGAIQRRHGTLESMVGDGSWGQPAGTVTDDTEQALCITRSLVECGEFDPADVAERFVAWYDSGPFDIGNTTARSLGGDADTTGAIAGAVAGARFDAPAVPKSWLEALEGRAELEALATELAEF